MNKPELLAPAGDIEAGYAALYYGADAVYLGLQKFSARATATNFDENSLCRFTGYAHSLNRKVYVAVNTVVQTDELDGLMETLSICEKANVDAVILQDLGVAKLIKTTFPSLVLHASTQMAVHNLEGALFLKKQGFSRVVLARELSLDEIKKVADTGIETEVFIHGALCYSYSGLCLFSSLISGKSANRGKCLYPCRSCFATDSGKQHLFSMKDLALKENILKLPVTSLKIEGRKKTALYVGAVTDYYRHILDGKKPTTEDNLKQIFARPWTEFHLFGNNKNAIDRDFVGHRGLRVGSVLKAFRDKIVFKTTHAIGRHDGIQIDIAGTEKPFGFSAEKIIVGTKSVLQAKAGQQVEIYLPEKPPFIPKGSAVYLASASEVKGAYPYTKPKPDAFMPRIAVDVAVFIEQNKIMATALGKTISVSGDFPKAQDLNNVQNCVRKAFEKGGESQFTLGELCLENKEGLFVPTSVLNEVRRRLYSDIEITEEKKVLPVFEKRKTSSEGKIIVKTDDLKILEDIPLDEVDEVLVEVSPTFNLDELKKIPKNKVRLALPTVCRHPKGFKPLIEKALKNGYKKWEVGNWWGFEVLPNIGIDLTTSEMIYTLNPLTVEHLKEMGVSRITFSAEDTLNNMKKLNEVSSLPVVWCVYQNVPLFISATCVRENACVNCTKKELRRTVRMNGQMYEVVSKNCQTTVCADQPFSQTEHLSKMKPDWYRVDFVGRKYTSEDIREIWTAFKNQTEIKGSLKGNFLKSL